MAELMVKCVNAHDRCYGGASGTCPYCEPVEPLRTTDGRFAKPQEPDRTSVYSEGTQ